MNKKERLKEITKRAEIVFDLCTLLKIPEIQTPRGVVEIFSSAWDNIDVLQETAERLKKFYNDILNAVSAAYPLSCFSKKDLIAFNRLAKLRDESYLLWAEVQKIILDKETM